MEHISKIKASRIENQVFPQMPTDKCRNPRNMSKEDNLTPHKEYHNASVIKSEDKGLINCLKNNLKFGHKITQKHREGNA